MDDATPLLTRFDHVTVRVHDVAAATARYEALLGAPAAWRGSHPHLGTRASLFGLANGWVELVGPDGDAPEAEGLRLALAAQGEGIAALAFGCDDAERLSATLRARGLRATAPQEGEARGDDGVVRTFRTVELSPKATRGVSVFAVERPAPLGVPSPFEPAAVNAIDHVVLRTATPDAALALYRDGLGIRLALDRTFGPTRMLFFRVGGVTLEVVADPSVGERDQLWGITYRVGDLDAAHARLSDAGFAVSAARAGNKPGTRVFGVRDQTCNVPTLILRDPARDPAQA